MRMKPHRAGCYVGGDREIRQPQVLHQKVLAERVADHLVEERSAEHGSDWIGQIQHLAPYLRHFLRSKSNRSVMMIVP